MNYWLLKSDPDEFSWEDLKKQSHRRSMWDGVRNYQARNFLKEMKKGDLAFFYHSSTQPQHIPGIVNIVEEAYPDFTQFNKNHMHYDPKATKENPIWFMVDIQFEQEILPPITRDELKKNMSLGEMLLFKNSRLSVLPVTPDHWKTILKLRKL